MPVWLINCRREKLILKLNYVKNILYNLCIVYFLIYNDFIFCNMFYKDLVMHNFKGLNMSTRSISVEFRRSLSCSTALGYHLIIGV